VDIDCPHAKPNDTCPHFTSASKHLLDGIYNACFDDLPLDTDNGGAFLSSNWNAGVFSYLSRMYTINCSGIFPAHILGFVLKGMVRSKLLFTPANFAICKAFLGDVGRMMWEDGGGMRRASSGLWERSSETQRLTWRMFSELILRVVGIHDDWPKDAEIVKPTWEMYKEVWDRAIWMKPFTEVMDGCELRDWGEAGA
jgi:hypothetical protein